MRQEGRAKARNLVLTVFIAVIMSTSIIGFLIVQGNGTSRTLYYNGFSFESSRDGTLVASVDGRDVPFTYFPKDLESVKIDAGAVGIISEKKVVYLASDIKGNFSGVIAASQYDLAKVLRDFRKAYVVQGYFQEMPGGPITCANATPYSAVVSFEEADDDAIVSSGYCVSVRASSYNGFVRMRDRLLYGLLGVMNGQGS